MRLLIVEDNAALADALSKAFERRGVACDVAADAAEAESLLEGTAYEALVLDLGLPDEDGASLLRRIRGRQLALPVIILTARGSLDERVAGLHAGADDYIVKPFDFSELEARLEAVLRRQSGYWGFTLERGNVKLNLVERQVTVAGATVTFSARELELLELLLRRPRRVLAKRAAEDQLFGSAEPPESNAVEVYVHRLRKRLTDSGATVTVETIRGVGYLLREVSP